MQIDVAKEQLPPHYCKLVGRICLKELYKYAKDWYREFDLDWNTIDAECICAIVNDAAKMSEQCEELFDFNKDEDESNDCTEGHTVNGAQRDNFLRQTELSEGKAKEDTTNKLITIQELSSKFAHLAVYGTERLSELILSDVKEPYLSQIGSLLWEKQYDGVHCERVDRGQNKMCGIDGNLAIVTTVETLRDYFIDL
eukprot:14438042-Ditylum_brightwellii.AAC.1